MNTLTPEMASARGFFPLCAVAGTAVVHLAAVEQLEFTERWLRARSKCFRFTAESPRPSNQMSTVLIPL